MLLKKSRKLIKKRLGKYKFKLNFYNFIFFIPSLAFLLILKIIFRTYLKSYHKIISLRISTKYFGHYAVEPAILSSFAASKNKIYPIVSFKNSKGINNRILEKFVRNSFDIQNDFLNLIMENTYNFCFKSIRKKLNLYYSPLIHPYLKCRDTAYHSFLESNLSFEWRKQAINYINLNDSNNLKLVIALRTEHFNRNINFNPQPWRDASIDDIIYLTKACCKVVNPKNIFLLYHPENLNILKNQDIRNLNLIDETKKDVLTLFSPNTVLINNGNGIGAAAYSIGLRTLYIHHTVWQFWHTSHSNALCLPSKFLNSKKRNNLKEIIEMAFSPNSLIPLDFENDYYRNGISINKIKDIDEDILIKTIIQMLNKTNKSERHTEIYLGCQFDFSSTRERDFWINYIDQLPSELKKCHNLIKLNISDSFLDSF